MQSPDGSTVAPPLGVLPEGGEIAGPAASRNLTLDDFLHNKRAVGGCVVVLLLVLFCFVGPLIYRTNMSTVYFRCCVQRTMDATNAARFLRITFAADSPRGSPFSNITRKSAS